MSALDFVASLVSSLAWPATAIVLVVILRKPIAGALSGDVKRWRAGPAGVEFEYWERKSVKVREALERASPQGKAALGDIESEELEEVARIAPVAAVLNSFARVEFELRSRLEDLGEVDMDRMSGLRLAQRARERGVINQETLTAIEGLAVLRNLAAHGRPDSDLDTSRALEFVHLADAVLYSIRAPRP